MRRLRFGSALAAVALASAAAIPLFAAPAGAALSCPAGGSFPNIVGAESNLKVDCTTAAGDTATSLIIHDGGNAHWHHGAAKSVVVTTAVNASTVTIAGLTAADVRRPISGFNSTVGVCLNSPLFQGGTFITSVTGSSVGISRPTPATCNQASGHATIEYTQSRVLTDVTSCAPSGLNSTLISPTAKFVTADINKSVTGGPYHLGAKITAIVGAQPSTTATVTSTVANLACTAPDTITIGAQTCAAGVGCVPAANTDPSTVEVHNAATTPVTTGFSCVAASHTLTLTAAGGTFPAVSSDIGLR